MPRKKSRTFYVRPCGERWGVQRMGRQNPFKVFDQKIEAWNYGKERCAEKGGRLWLVDDSGRLSGFVDIEKGVPDLIGGAS